MSTKSIGSNSFNKFILRKNNKKNKRETNVEIKKSNIFTQDNVNDIIDRKNISTNNESYFLNRTDSYDGLFSTQQLFHLDYSKFENHVYFDSAVDKVNFSFKKILNEFPYDKNKFKFDDYIKKNDGYTNYILEKVFPSNLGYLKFDGTYFVEITDRNGYLLNDFSEKRKSGILNPEKNKFAFDFWLKRSENNNNAIKKIPIIQKINMISSSSIEEGYTVFLSNIDTTNDTAKLCILLTNGNESLKSAAEIKYSNSEFNHFHIKVSSLRQKRNIIFYQNGKVINSTNTGSLSISNFSSNFNSAKFNIGKGTQHRSNNSNISIESDTIQNFKGYLDDLKVYKKSLIENEIIYQKNNTVHNNKYMCLYLKFNEITGEYANNQIVLDSSGNKIHGLLRKIEDNAKLTKAEASSVKISKSQSDGHIKYENKKYSPVLFPDFSQTKVLQSNLLLEAEQYDLYNPNAFWKLFPKHLFEEASRFEGKEETYLNTDQFSTNESNLNIETPANNTLIKILTIWSRFFDQLKCYIDSITEILNVNYESLNNENILGVIIPLLAKNYGYDFKDLFPTSLKDKLDGKFLTHEETISEKKLRFIQNEIWKRLLINTKDFVSSKGTKKSIKSIFNSVGLSHDKFIDIREYSGFNHINLNENYMAENRHINRLNFANKNIFNSTVYSSTTSSPEVSLDYYPKNKFILDIKDIKTPLSIDYTEDWSYECFYKFNINYLRLIKNVQSLLRINRKRDSDKVLCPYINLKFTKERASSTKGTLTLEINNRKTDDIESNTSGEKSVSIDNIDLLNGEDYYIAIRKKKINNKKDMFELICYQSVYPFVGTKVMSKSLFIKYENSAVIEPNDRIGEIQIGNVKSDMYTLNSSTTLSNPIKTDFEGEIFGLKIWDKYLSTKEVHRHMVDPNCQSLDLNSFENESLIVSFDLKEQFQSIDNTQVNTDISVNEFVFSDNLLNKIYENSSSTSNLAKSKFNYAILVNNESGNIISSNYDNIQEIINSKIKTCKSENIKIDSSNNNNNITINSYEDDYYKKINKNYNSNPGFKTEGKFILDDDNRFSIDFSIVKYINSDIAKIISANQFLTNELGSSESLYDSKYQGIEKARESYYKRLESNIDFKPLYQIFKYFDNILNGMLDNFIPGKVNYNGFNFVYESHSLERHKYEYKMSENRLNEVNIRIPYNFTKEPVLNKSKNFNQINSLPYDISRK